MINKEDVIYIKGCIPYTNKREKKKAWKTLKAEFADNVKILFDDGLLTYSAKVNRNQYF